MITVAVPTYNRSRILAETIQAIGRLRPPDDDWEVIVADNNSTDDTSSICRELLPDNGRYVFEERPGVSNARNRLIEEARGDLIVFTDDDTLPDPDWLAAYAVAARRHPEAAFFMGPLKWNWETERPGWYRDDPEHPFFFSEDRNLGHSDRAIPPDITPAGPNMAIRRDVFLRYGGFRSDLGIVGEKKIGGEEPELFRRYGTHGLNGYYIADAIVRHRITVEMIKVGSLVRGMLAAGFSDSLVHSLYWKGPRLLGMPRWWLRQFMTAPLRHGASIVKHAALGQSHACVYHIVRGFYWMGQVRYLGKRVRGRVIRPQVPCE